MDYNHATNRLVSVGYSLEADFCGNGNSSCNYVTMLENDKPDFSWSQTFDGLSCSSYQSVTFSPDGSLVAVMLYYPQTITLMNALTG